MTRTCWRRVCLSVACAMSWPTLLVAAAPADREANLQACIRGSSSCDRSRLTESERTEVVRADHARNVTACRRGFETCERADLSEAETIDLAVIEHDRNVENCTDGIGACDASRLTAAHPR